MNEWMLKLREIISLGAALVILGMAVYVFYIDDMQNALIFFGIAVMLFLFYILRRRLRIKLMQEKNK